MTPFGTVRKFNRIKIGREVLHGKVYACVSKRNSYTVVYNKQPSPVLHSTSCSHLVAIELHIPASCVNQHHLQLYRNLSEKHLLSLLILNQTLLLIIFKL